MPSTASGHHLGEIVRVFFKLGLTSFGGPVAHLGYFHEEIVRRRRWIDDAEYADLMALCQFLPGPASSQLVFALGRHRGGLAGACAASLCFMLPSAVLMIAFAYGLALIGDIGHARWLHGLKLAAVAVIAQAVWNMGRRLCPDWPRLTLAAGAAVVATMLPVTAAQVIVILGGALLGCWLHRAPPPLLPSHAEPKRETAGSRAGAIASLATFGLLLILLPLAASQGGSGLRLFDSFYRAGAFVFGGGHVILPLLRAELVPPGWIADDAFLAGYGAVQAMPGPLFTFAAYLGTVIRSGDHAWLGGLGCLFALFLPGWLLIGGTLPFWHLLRAKTWTQAAMRGANATVVGLLLAALITSVGREGIENETDIAIAIAALLLLTLARVPAWAVVLLCAGISHWL